MKKLVLILTILGANFLQAQQEVSIDLADALVIKTLEVTYEHYIGEQSSIGASALFNFEGENSDFRYNEDNMITPFFRHYFTTARNWNHFGEIFMGINSGKNDSGVSYTDGALGISVGTKYVSNGGLVISVHGGLGRNFFTDLSPSVVPRIGLNVGYRF
ncbi:hypothetical protein ACSIGC_11720 [Tenacibaculum sp. ZS6-P6]|uniref:hypothetical protein n=1 Tax=Tenacibaculum sp. ZS6-P6 TaxID=3447503 RepID=UPI003F993A03